jgi:hypothetical protein
MQDPAAKECDDGPSPTAKKESIEAAYFMIYIMFLVNDRKVVNKERNLCCHP